MTTPAQSSSNLFIRRPLLMYFVLAYAFFWGFLVLAFVSIGLLGLSPEGLPAWVFTCFTIIGSWMPNLAALTMTGLTESRAGNRKLVEKFINFRIPARWVLTALLPIALMFAAAGLYNLGGGTAPGNPGGQTLGFWLGLFGIAVVTGATGEEGGWRGYALPRLQKRFGPLLGSLILGLTWSFWHFPLWMISGLAGSELLAYILSFSLGAIGLTFFMTWLYNRAPNSLVPMIITHFALNFGAGLVGEDALGLAPGIPLMAIFGGLIVLVNLILWSRADRSSYG